MPLSTLLKCLNCLSKISNSTWYKFESSDIAANFLFHDLNGHRIIDLKISKKKGQIDNRSNNTQTRNHVSCYNKGLFYVMCGK